MYQFNRDGLIPVITQDVDTKEVLMLAYMNEEAINLTKTTRKATYFSRSRKELWVKGETSGNTQEVVSFFYDCDQDTILLKVKQKGVSCHTNHYSCFYRSEFDEEFKNNELLLRELFNLLKTRYQNRPEGSYTTYLFEKGVDKILKKVAEETGEVIIASKNNNEELIYEASDLLYHLLVLLVNQGVELSEIYQELRSRMK
jgi:phosphoribosyl-ATP pyrophosphohydrolase/phosphoribosyl-AMP cyclohydrolase